MNTTVYLLSILDGVNGTLGCAGVFGLLIGVIFFILYLVASDDRSAPAALREGRIHKVLLLIGAVCVVLNLFLPTTESLKNAYLYTEAAKLVTADNGEKAAIEVAKRVDRVLEIFDKRKTDGK